MRNPYLPVYVRYYLIFMNGNLTEDTEVYDYSWDFRQLLMIVPSCPPWRCGEAWLYMRRPSISTSCNLTEDSENNDCSGDVFHIPVVVPWLRMRKTCIVRGGLLDCSLIAPSQRIQKTMIIEDTSLKFQWLTLTEDEQNHDYMQAAL